MRDSREVLPTVERRLAADARFAGLRAFVSTGCNVVVYGEVAAADDERDLRAVLGDISFPHGVCYLVRIE